MATAAAARRTRPSPPLERTTSAGSSTSSSAAFHSYGPRYLRFLVNPRYSAQIILTALALYASVSLAALITPLAPFLPATNPVAPLLFLSYPVDSHGAAGGHQKYGKGALDVAFLAFYVVVLSFIRHALMQGPLLSLAKWSGVRKGLKTARFVEQAYAVVFFGVSGSLGLKVMSEQKSWWYQTDHFWTDYPTNTLNGNLKAYYLLQFAFWLQETFVILARLEKPRADNTQMTFHHLVTIWLIAESYVGNLEQIGLAVFVSMDLPDFMFSLSKCINYTGLENVANVSFLVFISTWSYFRHFLNIRMLISVWEQKTWMAQWLRMMIFVPMLLLQITITFWSYRILRVLFKLIKGANASDEREKGETDTEEEDDPVEEIESVESIESDSEEGPVEDIDAPLRKLASATGGGGGGSRLRSRGRKDE